MHSSCKVELFLGRHSLTLLKFALPKEVFHSPFRTSGRFREQVESSGSSLAIDFCGVVPLWPLAQEKFSSPEFRNTLSH